MSQAPPLIGPNKSGLTYRQEDNDGKQALLTHHKGATAPSYAQAGTMWLDDAATPWLLKLYDGVDWICLSQINATANTALPYAGQSASRGLHLRSDTGATDAYAVVLLPAISSYAAGQTILLLAATGNTGACTLAVDGLSPVAIKMPDGSNLPAGAMRANAVYLLCHDGTVFKLLNPSQGQTPAILQTQTATYSGYAAISSSIPIDDSIPTSTEGAEIISLSITPTTATSRMVLRVTGSFASNTATTVAGALVVHGDSAAFATTSTYITTVNQPIGFGMMAEHLPGSTAAITYKFRTGAGSGTLRPNGNTSGRLFGGTGRWMMTVEEYSQ